MEAATPQTASTSVFLLRSFHGYQNITRLKLAHYLELRRIVVCPNVFCLCGKAFVEKQTVPEFHRDEVPAALGGKPEKRVSASQAHTQTIDGLTHALQPPRRVVGQIELK